MQGGSIPVFVGMENVRFDEELTRGTTGLSIEMRLVHNRKV